MENLRPNDSTFQSLITKIESDRERDRKIETTERERRRGCAERQRKVK